MGVFDNIRKALTVTPVEDFQIAAAQSSEIKDKFSPGIPINPADGYSRTPRAHDFLTGYNIAARPRRNERVSFQTLQGLVEAYDIAQMAITHRIDSIRSLDWFIEPVEGFDKDAEATIAFAKRVLAKPDHELPFRAWLSKFLWDTLAYDAGTLYRMRNNAGQVIGLKVVDGTTIAPMIDYHGGRPTGDAPAYVQFAQGVPWNWLLDSDIIYVPFRPMPNSPYGKAPLESILLNANTDLRFQNYFLSRFTQGTVPEGFASAPESWGPDQIADFQDAFDALMYGDESKKHQIRWVPGGTNFTWSQENTFQSEFSLFLMRKTAAAFHVTPNDLGFTDTVNLANGETQTEVQFRIGSLPMIQHVQDILTSFLQDDLGLPVVFRFDTGAEKDDRLMTAQIAEIMIRNGVVSPSEVREDVYGLQEPDGVVIPRFINSSQGPIPIGNIMAIAGQTDNEAGMPVEGTPLPDSFTPAEGVIQTAPVVKGAITAGFYATTGANASPLIADPVDDDDDDNSQTDTKTRLKRFEEELKNPNSSENGAGLDQDFVKSELATYKRFVKARKRDGKWRDFNFTHIVKSEADNLNMLGRLEVEPGDTAFVSMIVVRAEDTGRILMIQRSLDLLDPNAGKLDFPGGHVKEGEDSLQGAIREFTEEVSPELPEGSMSYGWKSADTETPHVGFIYTIASEALIQPQGHEDGTAAVLWVKPKDLKDNRMVKDSLRENLKEILDAVDDALPLAKGWDEPATVTKETYTPTEGMKVAAKRALRWKDEGKAKGAGTPVGWGRATDIVAGRSMSEDVVKRMYSFFSRHEVDKKGEDFSDTANPSNGRIMWDAWGGDAGYSWSKAIVERLKRAELKKGWRDTEDVVPQHKFDIKIVDHYAPIIRDALLTFSDSLDYETVIEEFNNRVVKDAERDALFAQVMARLGTSGNDADIAGALLAVLSESYVAGSYAATEQTGGIYVSPVISEYADTVDWNNWKPGYMAGAEQLVDGGMINLLADADIRLKGMTDTVANAVGNKIAQGVQLGLSNDSIARMIREDIGKRWRAEAIAHTESTRGIMTATLDTYQANGIDMYNIVLSSNACVLCEETKLAGPYVSTDTRGMPPIHPFCRCATLPVFDMPTGTLGQ